MKCDDYVSSTFVNPIYNAPYRQPLAPIASASSLTSIWSDASSQLSDDSSTSTTSDSEWSASSSQSSVSSVGSSYERAVKPRDSWHKPPVLQVQTNIAPPQLRQNPRRTASSATSRTRRPPTLVRQAERKLSFVDSLVDSSTHIVEAIWPTSSIVSRNENGTNAVLPLRNFIQETLRRSRTSYSTLQVALYYLILIKSHVPKHDFTMEQPNAAPASQAIQCGRRMFLAALILASKYLQDRNYSARAWSKISGLTTPEINQNEINFLLAVNWKLHITDEVYNRWTECIMKFTPPQPPSPSDGGAQLVYEQKCEDFRSVILRLTPGLGNLDEVAPQSFSRSPTSFTPPDERVSLFGYESEPTVAPKPSSTPTTMEPMPAIVYTPNRPAPALGLLPTPRLTPQFSGFGTPAVGAASYLLGRGSSMGFAMSQASYTAAAQSLDRWSPPSTSPPPAQLARRSSLAHSVSTASSPESMVSDSSRVSRSSSISSASSLASAPSSKLDVQARCRYAKLCGERLSLKPNIASVPENYAESYMTASPMSYTGPVGKDLYEVSVDTSLARRQHEMDDAARALQDLRRHGSSNPVAMPVKAGIKRSRTFSMDNSLQDNVREMLAGRYPTDEPQWAETLLQRPRGELAGQPQRVPAIARGGRKRLCCSSSATELYSTTSSLYPACGGMQGPGTWYSILN